MLSRLWRLLAEFPGERHPTGCHATILVASSIFLSLGIVALVAWGATGNVAWVVDFFRIPGALLLSWLAFVEFWLALRVQRHFLPGEPLHRAWLWICAAALAHFLSAVCAQILSLNGGINPLAHLPNWTNSAAESFRNLGLVVGGTFRYALLAIGLFSILKVYRRAGFLGRWRLVDWVLLAATGAFVALEFGSLAVDLVKGKHPGLLEVVGWPVDPLLWLLFAEALLLVRSVREMGGGWISRCWRSYSIGIFLVLLGDLGLELTAYGYLPWPWNSVVWYIWLPAACAFAVAPAYQLETIYQASTEGARRPLRSLTGS